MELLVCTIRAARLKARQVAVAEALALLRDLEATAPSGGPLSGEKGIFWISLPENHLTEAEIRLPRLGYSERVELLVGTGGRRSGRPVRWQKRDYLLIPLYEEEPAELRQRAPDRRTFMLKMERGDVQPVQGYRGDSGELSRRGLPVYDARMLVNLAFTPDGGRFLDPFAGVGGIVLEAKEAGYQVFSGDVDARLRFGLAQQGARHAVIDSSRLPYPDESMDMIAAEPPYSPEADTTVINALAEMARVLKPGSRIAMLCAERQAEGLKRAGAEAGLALFLESPINRKGLDCAVLAWDKR